MKVILLENVASVGALGDVINVRPGYARNYLFPQGKAERASDEAIKQFETRRAELQERQERVEAALKNAQETLEGYLLQVTARASPDGNLYGSITPQMIAAAVNDQKLVEGLLIKRGQITLPEGQVKSLGEHPVSVRLSETASATFKISVLAENTPSAAPAQETKETTQETPQEKPQEKSADESNTVQPSKEAK